jgi:membrane protease YdiL (CAAX protease family)
MPIPFWIPALWIGATLALAPGLPLLTILGYHLICLLGAAAHGRPRWGRIPGFAWPCFALAVPVAAAILLQGPKSGTSLPTAGAQGFLSAWPGGFLSYAAYALTVNSLCEEAYWRHAMLQQRPQWQGWRHGLAFGLHHAIGNGLVFGWMTALPALLYTALGGWVAVPVVRRTGGLGTVILGHSALNLMSFAWLYGRV